MLPSHESLSDNQKNVSAAIRTQWRLFEKWLASSNQAIQSTLQDEFDSLQLQLASSIQDTPQKFHSLLSNQYDAKFLDLQRQLRQQSLQLAQEEWQRRLATARLNPEHWLDITPAERFAIEKALSPDFPESNSFPSSSSSSSSLPNASHAFTSLPGVTRALPSRAIPRPTPFEFADSSSLHDPLPHNNPSSIDSIPWSPEDYLDRRPPAPSVRFKSQEPPSISHNPTDSLPDPPSSEDPHDDASPKQRTADTRYIGPVLYDPRDAKEEEQDFERFKFEIRKLKIWEFHAEAAEADSHLSLQLCDRSLDKNAIRTLLVEHDSSMERLKRLKEDERKSIVEIERLKRRTEFRRRGALHAASASNPWKQFQTVINGHDRDQPNKTTPLVTTRGGQQFTRDSNPKHVNGTKPAAVAASWAHPQGQTTEPVTIPKDDHPIPSSSRQSPPTDDTQSHPPPSSSHPSQMPTSDDIWLPPSMRDKPIDPIRDMVIPPAKTHSRKASSQQSQPKQEREIETRPKPGDSPLGPSRTHSSIRAEEFWFPAQSEEEKPEVTAPPKETELAVDSGWQQIVRVPETTKRGRNGKTLSNAVHTSQPSRGGKGAALFGEVGESPVASSSQGNHTPTVTAPDVPSPATSSRPRTASDPPPQSPNPIKASAVQKQKSESAVADAPKQPKSILKKADTPVRNTPAEDTPPAVPPPPAPRKKGDKKRQKSAAKKVEPTPPAAPPPPPPPPPSKSRRRVTIEEVSDEEADPLVLIGSKETQPPDHPSDPVIIIEPKPSPPPTSFSHIFQYKSDEELQQQQQPASEPILTSPPGNSSHPEIWYPSEDPSADQEEEMDWAMLFNGGMEAGPLNLESFQVPGLELEPESEPAVPARAPSPEREERANKTKHVRWTPSVLARSGSPEGSSVSGGGVDALEAAFAEYGLQSPFSTGVNGGGGNARASTSTWSTPKVKTRGRASSFVSSLEGMYENGMMVQGGEQHGSRQGGGRGGGVAVRDLKGKGRERGVRDDRDRPIEGMEDDLGWAIESLKAMRSKPASAV